jgi:hypothetical protein
MPHVGVLYRQIQARQIDTIKVKIALNVFVNAVGRIQGSIDTISPEGDARDFVGREKRRRIELNRIPDAKEVCDRITTEARNRVQSSSHLMLSSF